MSGQLKPLREVYAYHPIPGKFLIGSLLLGPVCFGLYKILELLWGLDSEDKPNHLFALLEGAHKPTEPLWGLIAPLIGSAFPERAFEAAILAVYLLMIIGMLVCRFDWKAFFLVLFSPALIYLSGQALRQGLAIGVFLVGIGAYLRILGGNSRSELFGLLLVTIVAALIHNSMILAGLWLVGMYMFGVSMGWGRSLALSLVLVMFSGVLLIAGPAEGYSGFALLFLLVQVSLLLSSAILGYFRVSLVPMIWTLAFLVFGYTFTITGVRVVILLGMLSPLIWFARSRWLLFFSLFLLPSVAVVNLLVS